jgi:hypothetical protein
MSCSLSRISASGAESVVSEAGADRIDGIAMRHYEKDSKNEEVATIRVWERVERYLSMLHFPSLYCIPLYRKHC